MKYSDILSSFPVACSHFQREALFCSFTFPYHSVFFLFLSFRLLLLHLLHIIFFTFGQVAEPTVTLRYISLLQHYHSTDSFFPFLVSNICPHGNLIVLDGFKTKDVSELVPVIHVCFLFLSHHFLSFSSFRMSLLSETGRLVIQPISVTSAFLLPKGFSFHFIAIEVRSYNFGTFLIPSFFTTRAFSFVVKYVKKLYILIFYGRFLWIFRLKI